MTSDPRRAAELAVIEAARPYAPGFERLRRAFAALDSLPPPPPPGETERVRVAVYRNRRTGDLDFCATHQITPDRVLAIVTADIPTKPPAIPEVSGSVEAPDV